MNISWLVKNHVILVDPESAISLDDLTYLNEELTSWLNQNDGLVHLIVQTSNVRAIPINLPKVRHIIKFPAHHNAGWIIAIAPSQLVRTLGMMVSTLSAQTTLRFVQNYEEAVQFVLSEDDTIPEFPADL